MRKYLFLLVIVFTTACKTTEQFESKIKSGSEKQTETKIDSEITQQKEVTTKATNQETQSTMQGEKEDSETEIFITTYDTTKEVDETTGKSPILTEVTIRKTTAKKKNTSIQEVKSRDEKSDYKEETKETTQTAQKTKEQESIKQATKTVIKKDTSTGSKWAIFITFVAITIALIFLIKKSRIVAVVKKIFHDFFINAD